MADKHRIPVGSHASRAGRSRSCTPPGGARRPPSARLDPRWSWLPQHVRGAHGVDKWRAPGQRRPRRLSLGICRPSQPPPMTPSSPSPESTGCCPAGWCRPPRSKDQPPPTVHSEPVALWRQLALHGAVLDRAPHATSTVTCQTAGGPNLAGILEVTHLPEDSAGHWRCASPDDGAWLPSWWQGSWRKRRSPT